jgi:hypothetical protein
MQSQAKNAALTPGADSAAFVIPSLRPINSTGAKIFPINACGGPHLLGKKAFLIMLKEFTAGHF